MTDVYGLAFGPGGKLLGAAQGNSSFADPGLDRSGHRTHSRRSAPSRRRPGHVGASDAHDSRSSAPAVAAATSGYFKTPSGNIVCYHAPGPPRAFLDCGIKSGLVPAPPRRPCQDGGYAGDRVSLQATGRVGGAHVCGRRGCAGRRKRSARVLAYGKTWSGGGLRCTSAVTGLTCRNKNGHGFFLSRESWRASSASRTRRRPIARRTRVGFALAVVAAAALAPANAFAVPGSETASAVCTKANRKSTASSNTASMTSTCRIPVRQLLCGSFTGPGNEAMAIDDRCADVLGDPALGGVQADRWNVAARPGSAGVPRASSVLPWAPPSERRRLSTASTTPRCFPSGGKRVAHLALERVAPRRRSLEAGDERQTTRLRKAVRLVRAGTLSCGMCDLDQQSICSRPVRACSTSVSMASTTERLRGDLPRPSGSQIRATSVIDGSTQPSSDAARLRQADHCRPLPLPLPRDRESGAR